MAPAIWADAGLAFLETFDAIDLASLRQRAKANRRAAQPRQAIATMLFQKLRKEFQPKSKRG